MKTINKETLDEWLFDYFENNLSQADRTLLTDFLKNNPVYKADYESWKHSYINEPEIVYPKTENLLKEGGSQKFGSKYIWTVLVLLCAIGSGIIYFLTLQSTHSVPGENKTTNTISEKPQEKWLNKTQTAVPAPEKTRSIDSISSISKSKKDPITPDPLNSNQVKNNTPPALFPIGTKAGFLKGKKDTAEMLPPLKDAIITPASKENKKDTVIIAKPIIESKDSIQTIVKPAASDTTIQKEKNKPTPIKKKTKTIPMNVGF